MPLIPEISRKHGKYKIVFIFISTFLWLGVFLHLFPVWWMFSTSIKSYAEVFVFPPKLWPEHPSFAAYKLFFILSEAWGVFKHPAYIYFKNSVIMTGITMLIQVPGTALVAYALSKLHEMRLSRLLFLFAIGTMMIPRNISLIPNYLILQHFPFPTMDIPKIPFSNIIFPTHNFLDSYWAVILPASYNAFNVLLFKGFFDAIPNELINAARLDGASEFFIIGRIILPLSKPIFAVVSYFSFTAAWNNFMWPLIVLKKNNLWPISLMIYKMQELMQGAALEEAQTETGRRLLISGMGINGIMALAVIESIPTFIMFIIFREYLMTGIKLRGFK